MKNPYQDISRLLRELADAFEALDSQETRRQDYQSRGYRSLASQMGIGTVHDHGVKLTPSEYAQLKREEKRRAEAGQPEPEPQTFISYAEAT